MPRERKTKDSKGRCESDVLQPTTQAQGQQCEDITDNSRGSPRSQRGFKTNSTLDDRNHGNKENKDDNRRVLLVITVEIEDGCVEHIEMKEGDSAEAVAMKFCRDHSLPDQFVAPLTEHIVSNIISISKEDKGIVFCSKDECASYDKNWPRKEGNTPQEHHDSESEQRSTRSWGTCNNQLIKTRSFGSEKENNYYQKGQKSPPVTKPRAGILQKQVSDRLIAPTVTSLAKSGNLVVKEESKPYTPRPNSEEAKAVYMRLYTEFVRQKQKQEEDQKRSFETYQEKINKDRMSIPKKSWKIMLMRGRTAKQYKNYGELLYSEGLTKRENQLKLIAQKQKDDEARELAELTGIPEISKRAKNLRTEHGKVWKRLNHIEEKPRQDQLHEIRNEIWEAQFMECTFKPQINHRRDFREDYKDGSSDRFEQLFLDAESRRRRQAEYMQWYPEGVTFRPTINRVRLDGVCTSGEYSDVHQDGTVFDRLLQYASKLTEKKQMQEHLVHKPVDPATGRKLFKPLTGRKPQNDRNPVHLPIGEYLYRLKFAFDSKKESIVARDTKIKKDQASSHYVGPTSQKLLGRLTERGFKKVFECLDEDKDGKVVLATANYDRLSADVVQHIMDVVKTQEIAETPLPCNKFVELMCAERKCNRATLHLVLKHKPHSDNNNFTYQFKMDRLSRNLASRRRKFCTNRQWYKIICTDREQKQRRVEELRKEKQDQEMAECTFRPELITKSSKKGSRIKGGGMGFAGTISSIVEKVQQEVHGFYFQDERGPEWLGLPANEPDCNATSRAPSREAVAVQVSSDRSRPKGLFESFKVMVSESLSSQGARRSIGDQPTDIHRQGDISSLNDLPETTVPKSGLYFGIMGA